MSREVAQILIGWGKLDAPKLLVTRALVLR